MKRSLILFFVALVLVAACSSKKSYTNIISGKITVADSVDATKDYSGIGYLVIKRDSTQKADTIFYAQTDAKGNFSGKAITTEKGLYPVYITRNKKILASSSIILTESDSVKIRAELPAYNQTEKLFSKEYAAKDVFDRLNKNFSRIAQFVNAGKVTPDTLPIILKNWSDIYWSVHRKYPKTIAANESVVESIRLLAGIDDAYLLNRYDSLKSDPDLRVALARAGGEAVARLEGLDKAIEFLKKRQQEAPTSAQSLQIIRNEIELLADSNEYARAHALIKEHQQLFNTIKGAKSWATYFSKETGRLAPGNPMPNFKLSVGKDSVNNASYLGKVFVLEIAGLSTETYQEQFNELNSIVPLYASRNVSWLTIPLDPQTTIDAFVSERKPNWKFANAHNFKEYQLMDSLNVIQIPTRFLIDTKGNIIRKYKPSEINWLLNDILKAVRTEDDENS
jgi:peroxiredoxin